MPWTSHLPIIMVLLGIFLSFILPVVNLWRRRWSEIISLTAMAVMFATGLFLLWRIEHNGPFKYAVGEWPPPWGIEFNVDYLGVYMMIVISGIGFLALLYATKDLPHELSDNSLQLFYPLYMLLMASMIGMGLTNDLFNLFVLLEITLLSSVTIICVKQNRETIEASLKYLILNAMGSAALLMGIAITYLITGHLNMDFISEQLSMNYSEYNTVIIAVVALFLVGFGVKSALFPMHVWLPDAHGSAPSPSSAILSGLVIKIYAVALARVYFLVIPEAVLQEIPITNIMTWLAAAGMIVGSMFAIVQEDIKKMLAYSSVAQIGYVFLGVGLLTITGFQGGIIHILNHAIIKAMLFLIAGAIIYSTGIRQIADMNGLGIRFPWLMLSFTIGAFAMIGIPGTNGFISKWYLALGALDAGKPGFVLVILISSLLNGVYYLPIVINGFFGEMDMNRVKSLYCAPIPWQMWIPIVFLGIMVIAIGLFPAYPLDVAEEVARVMLGH